MPDAGGAAATLAQAESGRARIHVGRPEKAASVVGAGGLVQSRFHAARERFVDAEGGARKRVIAVAKCTDAAIRENPYQAIAAGVLLGRLRK